MSSRHNNWSQIGYLSKTLIAAGQKYSTAERECLSVVLALQILITFVEGTELLVRSDHDVLRWMMNFAYPNVRWALWRLSLFNFYFTVVYMPFLVNKVPYARYRCKPNVR